MSDEVRFFSKQSDLRKWLAKNHAKLSEQWIGFYKKGSGIPSITWPESVDEALCFGWIDGIRKSIDAERYKIRFTPRKPHSIWSSANIKRVGELAELGFMMPAGIAEFEKRTDGRSNIYAYEQEKLELDKASLAEFKKDKVSWKFFDSEPHSYKTVAIWWVTSAKRQETREKRLKTLIADSAAGVRIAHQRRGK